MYAEAPMDSPVPQSLDDVRDAVAGEADILSGM
jgi:hypothetical protein